MYLSILAGAVWSMTLALPLCCAVRFNFPLPMPTWTIGLTWRGSVLQQERPCATQFPLLWAQLY